MLEQDNQQFQELKQLMEIKEHLVQEGKYLEAGKIKHKINEMKKGSNIKKRIHFMKVK